MQAAGMGGVPGGAAQHEAEEISFIVSWFVGCSMPRFLSQFIIGLSCSPCNPACRPLIWVECLVERPSRSRTDYVVKARSQFKERSVATNVEIILPLPSDTTTPVTRCSQVRALHVLCMPDSGLLLLLEGRAVACARFMGASLLPVSSRIQLPVLVGFSVHANALQPGARRSARLGSVLLLLLGCRARAAAQLHYCMCRIHGCGIWCIQLPLVRVIVVQLC
jgi:hypothetical protein